MAESIRTWYRIGDRVRPIPGAESAVDPEIVLVARQRGGLEIVDIEELEAGPCDCRRPRRRNHRRWCASLAIERNGGHPQLLHVLIDGRRHRLSAALVHRPS